MVSVRYKVNKRVCVSVMLLVVICTLAAPLYTIASYNVSRHKWFFSRGLMDLPVRDLVYFNTRKWEYDGWTPGFPKWLVDMTEFQDKLPRNVTSSGHHEIVYYNDRPADRMKQENTMLKKCPYKNCHISSGRAKSEEGSAVIFEISHHDMGMPPAVRPEGQVWVFNDFEPPLINERWDHRHRSWNGQFNWSLSYRYDSDIIRNFGYLKSRKPEKIPRTDYHEVYTRKTKFAAWFVSNCGSMTMSARNEYIAELKKYIPIDIYGKCGTLVANRTYDVVKGILADYKFFLSFENSFCTDYITEKFFQYFDITDAVLVVRGGGDYDQLFPQYTHINAQHYMGAKDLASYMLTLNRSENEYVKYLKTRDKYDVVQMNWACNLCIKLNNKNTYTRTYGDLVGWWHTDKCWAATDVTITWTAKRKWTALFLVVVTVIAGVYIYVRKPLGRDFQAKRFTQMIT